MSSIIKARKLSKIFGSKKKETTVINQLDIDIPKARFTMIMGSSGSGKSTLLYLLSGMDQPTAGVVEVDGTILNHKSEQEMADLRRNRIGFVFQDHNLISSLTLKENILLAGYLTKRSRKSVQNDADRLMERLGIGSLKHRFPTEVSGGQKQRCAIARAMINNPSIIMADEPTGNLNSSASENVLECLAKLKEDGQSILMVTHDPKSASYADEVLFIQDGTINDSISFETQTPRKEKQKRLINWLQDHKW